LNNLKSIFFLIVFSFESTFGATISRPVLLSDRSFSVQQNVPAINLSNLPINTFVYAKAQEYCSLDLNTVQAKLSNLLNSSESVMISSIRTVLPNFKISDLNDLTILIDSFGKATSAFRSFYIHPKVNSPAAISLDCAPASRASWSGLLGHEIIHHLNHNRNLSSWMDEMLSQVVEVRASMAFPYPRVQTLQNISNIPGFFAADQTFKSSEQYATNLLYGMYLSQNFGGSEVFQFLNRNVVSLADLAGGLLRFTEGKSQYDYIRNHINGKGLIRNFALALNINQPILNGGSVYQVPGWTGFSSSSVIKKSDQYNVAAGGFLRLDGSMQLKTAENSSLEIYRILKTPTAFKIQNPSEPIDGNWSENILLLINTSETESLNIQI